MRKALEKAENNRLKDIEKERVKMEAKVERERRKNGTRLSDITRAVDNTIEKFADTKLNIDNLPTGIAPLAEDATFITRPFVIPEEK